MRRHWSGVIRLIAIIAGLGAGIWEKIVLGGGWIPAMTLMILFFWRFRPSPAWFGRRRGG